MCKFLLAINTGFVYYKQTSKANLSKLITVIYVSDCKAIVFIVLLPHTPPLNSTHAGPSDKNSTQQQEIYG